MEISGTLSYMLIGSPQARLNSILAKKMLTIETKGRGLIVDLKTE